VTADEREDADAMTGADQPTSSSLDASLDSTGVDEPVFAKADRRALLLQTAAFLADIAADACEALLQDRATPDCAALVELIDALAAAAMPSTHAHMLQQAVLTRALDTVCFSSGVVAGDAITVQVALVLCRLAVDHIVFRRTSMLGQGTAGANTSLAMSPNVSTAGGPLTAPDESSRLGFGFLCTVFQMLRSLLVYPAMMSTATLTTQLGRLILYLLRPSLPLAHGEFVANNLSTHAGILAALASDAALMANIFVALAQHRERSLAVGPAPDAGTLSDPALRRLLADHAKALKSTVDVPAAVVQPGAPWKLVLHQAAVVELALVQRQWRAGYEAHLNSVAAAKDRQLATARALDASTAAEHVRLNSATIALQSQQSKCTLDRLLLLQEEAAQVHTDWAHIALTCTQPLAVWAEDLEGAATPVDAAAAVAANEPAVSPQASAVYYLDSTEGRARTRRRLIRRHIPEAFANVTALGARAGLSTAGSTQTAAAIAAEPPTPGPMGRNNEAAWPHFRPFVLFVERWLRDHDFVRLASFSPAERARLCRCLLKDLPALFPAMHFPSLAEIDAMIAARLFDSMPVDPTAHGPCASCHGAVYARPRSCGHWICSGCATIRSRCPTCAAALEDDVQVRLEVRRGREPRVFVFLFCFVLFNVAHELAFAEPAAVVPFGWQPGLGEWPSAWRASACQLCLHGESTCR
jgi:hypothetical protein